MTQNEGCQFSLTSETKKLIETPIPMITLSATRELSMSSETNCSISTENSFLRKDTEEQRVLEYGKMKIEFGKTVKGLSLKEILNKEREFKEWLKWLKYNSKNTKDSETADKAIAYFSRFSSIWKSL